MQKFQFFNPTKVVFGEGQIASLAELVAPEARVLVLYGGGSAEKTGTLAQVRAALAGRVVKEFGGIEPNPSYETLQKAVAQVRQDKIDFLLAVGGGSVIDGTKFVAAAALYEGDDAWEILLKRGTNIKQALPLGVVLTLPATGSEMNNGGVITRQATHTKLPFMSAEVFPRFAILDPTRSYTLPQRQVANGVVDAYVHVIEQYLTYPAKAMVQDRFAEGLLRTLIELGPQVVANPQDYDLQANLMWTASLALNGLIGAGVPQDWASHALGHELTALYGIDHARTLAAVLPAMLIVRRSEKREKLLQYAERVWDIRQGSEDERIDAAITRTREFFEQLGLPTRLHAYELDARAIDAVAANLENNGMAHLGERGNVSIEVSRQVLSAAL